MSVPPSAVPSPVPSYSPGLEGVIAGESSICHVDPVAGLLYRGYDVDELASQASFEDIVWLLLHDDLPDSEQYESIREQLAEEHELPEAVVGMLRLLPETTAPIDALRTGVSMLAGFDADLADNGHEANVRKAVRLIARTSTLVTSYWQVRRGQEAYAPGGHLSHAARFLFSLSGVEPEPHHISAFNVLLALYAEHEFNASTFAARVTASTLADMYAAVTAAIGALKGPLHGGANEQAMSVLRQIGTVERVEPYLKERLGRKEKIMGFGHRVYRTGDSRVPAVRHLLRQLGGRLGQPQWAAICQAMEQVMAREKGLCANLDLYAAPVLYLMGIPPELNTPIFAAARVAGWCAHVIEQHDHNRLIRPRCLYIGHPRRAVRRRGAGAG